MPKSPASLIGRSRRHQSKQPIPTLEKAPLPIQKEERRIVQWQRMMPRWASQLNRIRSFQLKEEGVSK